MKGLIDAVGLLPVVLVCWAIFWSVVTFLFYGNHLAPNILTYFPKCCQVSSLVIKSGRKYKPLRIL